MQESYRIPAHRIEDAAKAVAKLNKRADKLGIDPIILTDTGERETVNHERGVNYFGEKIVQEQVWATVTVSGGIMKLADWSFVATIEHTDSGNVIRRLPGDDREFDLRRFRNSGRVCDHCRLDRRRNDTYIVANEDGRLAQVGSNCLIDFTGGYSRDPHALVKFMEAVYNLYASIDSGYADDADEGGYGFRIEQAEPIEGFMAVTQAAVHAHGWMSRGKAYDFGGVATADIVWSALFERDTKDYKPWRPSKDEYETGKVEAVPMIEWARNISEDEDNDYLYNLRVACLNDYVTRRRAGIVASLYVAYQRAMERELEIKRNASKENVHIGRTGEKLTIPVTVVGEREVYSDFGTSYLYSFEDSKGRSLKWFSSRNIGLKRGDEITIKGTIKKHDEYKGRKSTILTRCKVEA